MLGGEIGVESAPGKGSTFWFTARLEKNSSTAKEPADPVELLRNLRGARCLVVDDNATNRDILRQQLGAWGIQVDSAANGTEALAMLRAGEPYAFAILDLHMPGMDGLELAQHIRNTSKIALLKLVLLSSMGHDVSDATARKLGLGGVLTKPVSQSQLFDCIVKLMDAPRKTDGFEVADIPERGYSRLNAKVLLVEDNPVNREVAIAMLQDLCSQVEVAGNGHEAVAAFSGRISDNAFDLILMDCQMPEMDGFAATAEIRRQEASAAMSSAVLRRPPRARRIPIIALTADAMHGDRERCLAAGMDDYLSKPFSQEQLDAVLRRWLPAGADRKPAARTPVPAPRAGGSSADRRLLDFQALDRIRALQRPGAPDILKKVITLYLEDAPKLLDALRDAVARSDCAAMQRAAHTCKSSSANLGALRLAGLCEEMEHDARAGSCEQAQARLGIIEDEYKKLVPALQMQFNPA